MLRITRDHDGTSTVTTADGSLVYAFITPPLPNRPGLTYAKPSPIPNIYCMFATLDDEGHFNPLEDKDPLEFDFPFATAWAYAFTTLVDMLKLPDHGHGHVVPVVGGRTMLVHAVRPGNTADDILALAAATEQYYPLQVAKISPEVFWVKGKEWRSLTPKESRGIFLPEDFPVKRDANGAPLTSGGGAGTRA